VRTDGDDVVVGAELDFIFKELGSFFYDEAEVAGAAVAFEAEEGAQDLFSDTRNERSLARASKLTLVQGFVVPASARRSGRPGASQTGQWCPQSIEDVGEVRARSVTAHFLFEHCAGRLGAFGRRDHPPRGIEAMTRRQHGADRPGEFFAAPGLPTGGYQPETCLDGYGRLPGRIVFRETNAADPLQLKTWSAFERSPEAAHRQGANCHSPETILAHWTRLIVYTQALLLPYFPFQARSCADRSFPCFFASTKA